MNEIPRILRQQVRISEINLKKALSRKNATGKLRGAIRYEVTSSPTESTLKGGAFTGGFPYWKVVDGGTKAPFKGIMPETPDFRAWMRARGIPKEASFPIRRKISKDGLKPTFIFSTENKRTFVDVMKKIPEGWMLEVRNEFIEFKNF